MSYLGVDIGTSGLRALLVTDEGKVVGDAEQSYPTAHPHSGWSEQDPADLTAALDSAVVTLRAAYPEFRHLRGIGVAGHMHGASLLDANDTVLRPCILWNDTRAHAEAATLDADPDFRTLSGNIVFPGFTAPKLAWLRTHEPDVFKRIAKVLLPAGYLNHYLTGDTVADVSDSAGTAWLDVGLRDWSDTLLTATQMHKDQMPRLVEGCAAAGLLRSELAQKWGLNGDVVIAGVQVTMPLPHVVSASPKRAKASFLSEPPALFCSLAIPTSPQQARRSTAFATPYQSAGIKCASCLRLLTA